MAVERQGFPQMASGPLRSLRFLRTGRKRRAFAAGPREGRAGVLG